MNILNKYLSMKKIAYSIFFMLILFLIIKMLFYIDPKREIVEKYLLDNYLIFEVGEIKSLNLFQIRNISSGIKIGGEFTPAYSIYRYDVIGDKGSVEVRIRISDYETDQYDIEIEKIRK